MNKNFAVLDYDGYICKAFYAAMAKSGNPDDALEILERLTKAAITKAAEYYKDMQVDLRLILSGHSWKKELYSDYKKSRDRNPYIGVIRDYVINEYSNVIKPETLEADEACIMCHDFAIKNGDSCIIFSDDKDLRYASLVKCKINLTEKIETEDDTKHLYCQMLAGDKEDDIQGIHKVGLKTAEKLLKNNYDIENVISIYKNKKVSKKDCIKNINLIIPMKREFNANECNYDLAGMQMLYNCNSLEHANKSACEGQLKFLKQKVDEVYGNE